MNCSVIEEVHAIPFVLRPLIDDFFQVKEARELNRLLNESIKKNLMEIPNQQIALAYSVDEALQRFNNISIGKKIVFRHLLEKRICSFIAFNKELLKN